MLLRLYLPTYHSGRSITTTQGLSGMLLKTMMAVLVGIELYP